MIGFQHEVISFANKWNIVEYYDRRDFGQSLAATLCKSFRNSVDIRCIDLVRNVSSSRNVLNFSEHREVLQFPVLSDSN